MKKALQPFLLILLPLVFIAFHIFVWEAEEAPQPTLEEASIAVKKYFGENAFAYEEGGHIDYVVYDEWNHLPSFPPPPITPTEERWNAEQYQKKKAKRELSIGLLGTLVLGVVLAGTSLWFRGRIEPMKFEYIVLKRGQLR